MFSFQKSDDLQVLHNNQIPCSNNISFQQQARRNQQDLHVVAEVYDHVTMEQAINITKNSSLVITKVRKQHEDLSPNSSKPNSANYTDQGLEDHCKDHEHTVQRKLAHRETERQRRQEMAKLYASLRGLLPLEFVKGKRSTSDHMHQAVKYIKHMQENIRVLSVKRDQLKKFVDETSFPAAGHVDDHDQSSTNYTSNEKNLLPNTVTVSISSSSISSSSSSCNMDRGIIFQILINSCLIEDGFPLSGVLKAISEQGLSVITCTCSKVNGRLFHSIQSQLTKKTSSNHEANDSSVSACSTTDLSTLQQRLTAVANNY